MKIPHTVFIFTPSPTFSMFNSIFPAHQILCLFFFLNNLIKSHLCHPHSLGFVAFYGGMVGIAEPTLNWAHLLLAPQSEVGLVLTTPCWSGLCRSCTRSHSRGSSLVWPPCVWNTLVVIHCLCILQSFYAWALGGGVQWWCCIYSWALQSFIFYTLTSSRSLN